MDSSPEPREADRFARVARELIALRQTSGASPRDPRLIAIDVPVYNDWAAFRIGASLGNRLVLRSAMPNAAQIAAWDRLMVPLSRRLDPWLRFRAGKSVLGVWTR